MRLHFFILILSFLSGDYLFHFSKIDQTELEWELKKEKNGIQVFTRDSAGSGITEIRVLAIVKAPVEKLVETIYDVDSYFEWVANLESAKILETVNDREIYYYFQAEVPWPFSNRDDVMRFVMEENINNDGVTIVFSGHPDYIPKKNNIKRLTLNKGYWKFTPLSNGETEIDYLFFTDEGEGYPNWIVSMFIVNSPYKTVANLKEFVNKD
jgi:ribosome-associated toxin RatA of RatAB toxin-antitoxin module